MGACGRLLVHDLLLGCRLQLVDLLAQAMLGEIDILLLEIAQDLANYIIDAGLAEVGGDDIPGIGLGLLRLHAHELRSPETQELVAPHFYPELQLLIMLELFFESLLAIGKGQIGRASCRERGEVWVGAGALYVRHDARYR